jgi:O-antigen/teichoic acid export membrane protein
MLLGIYSSMTNVGIFSLVTSANLLGRVANMAVRTSLRPTLAETLDREDKIEAEHLYQATTRWTLTANLPVFLVMILYPTAILSLFGESFEAGAAALFVLAFAELANAATGTCGAVIDMSGLNLVKLINKIFEVVLTLVLNVVFIVRWGLMGAAVATLLSSAAIQLIRLVEVRIFVGLHPYNVRILKPVLAAVVALAAGLGINQLVPAEAGVFPLFFNALVVGGVYVGMVVALGISAEDREILRAIRSKVRLPIGRAASKA